MTAGPTSVTRNAAVMDWPDKNGKMGMLREGTNGWVCMPSNPPTKYKKNDSMCLDAQWREWLAAAMEKRPPMVTKVGYPLRPCDVAGEMNWGAAWTLRPPE